MHEISISELLHTLSKAQLNELIENLLERNSQVRLLVLEWLNENLQGTLKEPNADEEISCKKHISDKLLLEYWENARDIISDFNLYGGGPDDKESEAYDWLEDMSGLINQGDISPQVKRELLDEIFVEYDEGNSGFDDTLTDLFFELCKTREEWEYLVSKLEHKPSSWRNKMIMDIQKKYLGDDTGYLKRRLNSLQYGLDYWDLVRYYLGKKVRTKALETAEVGILKGEGRLTELFDFLFAHFAQINDTVGLERIVEIAVTRNMEAKYLLDKLFEYYKGNSYEQAKTALLKAYKHTRGKQYFAEYQRMKAFLTEKDWKLVEHQIIDEAKENNIGDYLRICLDKGMKEIVLSTIISSSSRSWPIVSFDEFAAALEEDYPEKIIEYYLKKAHANINGGNRNTYHAAVRYLEKIRRICIAVMKNGVLWEIQFVEIKNMYKKRPAFIDVVRQSKLLN